MTLEEIERIVREKLARELGPIGAGPTRSPTPGAPRAASTVAAAAPVEPQSQGQDLVNQDVVLAARDSGKVYLKPGAIVTPLAREEAERLNVELIATSRSPRSIAVGRAPANPRRIAVGCDHGGFVMKTQLIDHLRSLGCEVLDLGTDSNEAVDYPDFAHKVAQAVATGEAGRGLIIDGVGIGSAIVANKVPGIRAAHCHNLFEVRNSREHNDANILTLGGRVIGDALAKAMLTEWLETSFGGGRHAKRVDKIKQIETEYVR